MSTLRIAVVGARGRLGAHAADHYDRSPGFEVVARIERGVDLRAALRDARAEVALDATEAGLGARHARLMLEAGVRPLVGTSGVTEPELAELDALARGLGLGGLVVPNFSLGIVLLQRAALEFARHMPQVEIIELHHERKKDAPSGTAIDTARKLAAARPGRRGSDPLGAPARSLRAPGGLVRRPGRDPDLAPRHGLAGGLRSGPAARRQARCARRRRGAGVGARAGDLRRTPASKSIGRRPPPRYLVRPDDSVPGWRNGRRGGFKIRFPSKEWGFKSPPRHQLLPLLAGVPRSP